MDSEPDRFDGALPLDPALIAEIDALEPAYPVPDSVGRVTAEALDYLVHMLALNELHELLWHGYEHSGLSNEDAALWAERTAQVLAEWLRDHGVPQVAFWFPSVVVEGQWIMFKLSAADAV
jgi:hypothetical protein